MDFVVVVVGTGCSSQMLEVSLPSATRHQNSSQQKLKSMSSSVLSLGVSQVRGSARSDNFPGKAATSSLALILRSPSELFWQCNKAKIKECRPTFLSSFHWIAHIPPNALNFRFLTLLVRLQPSSTSTDARISRSRSDGGFS